MNFQYIRTIQKFLNCTAKEAILYGKRYMAIVKQELEDMK